MLVLQPAQARPPRHNDHSHGAPAVRCGQGAEPFGGLRLTGILAVLGWPAIERQIAQALGEGDWRPSLNWLDVVELLDKPPRGLTSRLRPLAPADPARDTGGMVDDTARDLAIYQALKAADEVAAALQTHLIEEHGADPERAAPQAPAAISLRLLRQARERLGRGLRAIEADHIAASDEISLRRGG